MRILLLLFLIYFLFALVCYHSIPLNEVFWIQHTILPEWQTTLRCI